MVHRDIKPYNLLLTGEDEIKICDFGLSRLRGETFPGPRRLHVGSPYYTAPEQEKDPDLADPRSDLYSAGVVLYRLITGRLPGEGYDRWSDLPPALGPLWPQFIGTAAAPRAEDRFPSAKAMRAELEALARDWENRRQDYCALPPEPAKPVLKPERIRRRGKKVAPSAAAEEFDLDPLGRPRQYHYHDFEGLEGGVVFDKTAGLIWQAGGSDFPLTREEANGYIREINAQNPAGRNAWRLPTVDELLTLLKPPSPIGESCLSGSFDPGLSRLWSADHRSALASWGVDADLGFAAWFDRTCPLYVRAVTEEGAV